MKPIYFAAFSALVLSCSLAQSRDQHPHISAKRVAFISQCKYSNGIKIILIYRFGANSYTFIIRRGQEVEVSIITPLDDENLDIETNGGVGKMVGIGTLFRFLLNGPFRSVGPKELEAEMARQNVVSCPRPYPFSP